MATKSNNRKAKAAKEAQAEPENVGFLKKVGDRANRIQVQFNIDYKGHPGQKMNPDSDTVPDMNLTVRQLLQNHTRGIDNKVEVKTPLYFDFPIPTINDITDLKDQLDIVKQQKDAILQFMDEHHIDPETGKQLPGYENHFEELENENKSVEVDPETPLPKDEN